MFGLGEVGQTVRCPEQCLGGGIREILCGIQQGLRGGVREVHDRGCDAGQQGNLQAPVTRPWATVMPPSSSEYLI